jgi:hypothetical protein
VNKLLELFRTPSAAMLMQRELEIARRSLLEAMSARDYALSMVHYHETRIDRLRSMIEMESIAESRQSP